MKYIVKNKTTKNIALLINGSTDFLYPKGDLKGRDHKVVDQITPQLRNIKILKFIQISKVDE